MDVDGEGKVNIKTFKSTREDLKLPEYTDKTLTEKIPAPKLFKIIDVNEDELISM